MPAAVFRRDLSVVVLSLVVTGCAAALWLWATGGPETAGPPTGPRGGRVDAAASAPAVDLAAPAWPADEPIFVVRSGSGDATPGSREQFLLFRWEEEPGAADYQLRVLVEGRPLDPITTVDPWYQLDVMAFHGQLCLEVVARSGDGRTGPASEPRCHVLDGPLPFAPPPWPEVPIDPAPAGEPAGTVVVTWVDIGFAAFHRVTLTLDDFFLEERVVAPGTDRAEFDLTGRTGQLCATVSAFGAEIPASDPSEPACLLLG